MGSPQSKLAVGKSSMGRVQFGRLTEAWRGEATDFTPLLAERLDQLGNAIGVDLASVGTSEVSTAGGRRIDIVARDADGAEFVIENQYGKADHDHLTRGLAYAVASGARGLIVVAEEHRDESRAVAEYLNGYAALDADRGIAVWLVEARAVKVDDSAWAPLFTAVVVPNEFVSHVEQAAQPRRRTQPISEFVGLLADPGLGRAVTELVERWKALGHSLWLGSVRSPGFALVARGPARNGKRAIIAVYPDGHIMVPFHSYAGANTGIPVDALMTPEFRGRANRLFGFDDSRQMAVTAPGWLTPDRVEPLLEFCEAVAVEYAKALEASQ